MGLEFAEGEEALSFLDFGRSLILLGSSVQKKDELGKAHTLLSQREEVQKTWEKEHITQN